MIVADTDVLIDALRGEAALGDLIEKLLRERRLATTTINEVSADRPEPPRTWMSA